VDAPTVRPFAVRLEYPAMPDQSNVLPPSRLVRWVAVGVLIGVSVALYFTAGRHTAPLTAAATSGVADSTR